MRVVEKIPHGEAIPTVLQMNREHQCFYLVRDIIKKVLEDYIIRDVPCRMIGSTLSKGLLLKTKEYELTINIGDIRKEDCIRCRFELNVYGRDPYLDTVNITKGVDTHIEEVTQLIESEIHKIMQFAK